MRFGRTLSGAIYPTWKDQYMDYNKLKSMLREDTKEPSKWTDDDENKFCDEIFNVELEKVAVFQEKTFKNLECRSNKAAAQLQELTPEGCQARDPHFTAQLKKIEAELDEIITETKELKKYSEMNYTAFLKIVKKHDRKRGNNYKIRPMLLMSLSKRPFNSEQGYSPLFTKLSMLYYAVRQHIDEELNENEPPKEDKQSQSQNGGHYTSYKFWIHPENLLEVKTYILRRLPVLIYSQHSSKDPDAVQGDPTLNSLYLDSPDFILYNRKVDRHQSASSLRIRWFGQLNDKPELFVEQKTVHENGMSEEKRFQIKEKYIQPFIKGQYKMEKSIAKMERQEQPEIKIEEFKKTVSEIQSFILDNELQPALRAHYTRTAFQKPFDERVRISIDTNLVFIREDCLDQGRPCRNPDNWHRLDVDNARMSYPFSDLNQGEINRFPYAQLEIKVKDDGSKKSPQWVEDLMASHLVHKTPRFSKFVHGIAVSFEDHVNNLPFWLSDLEVDIRKDPQVAFEEEEQRKAIDAENDQVVGSLLGTSKRAPMSYKANIAANLSKSYIQGSIPTEERVHRPGMSRSKSKNFLDESKTKSIRGYQTMISLFPSFSNSRYAQARRRSVVLPPGVTKPELLIKDSGPVHIEPKVWFANERTFVKWMQISIQLAVLGVGLNAAGSAYRSSDKQLAAWFSVFYVIIAAFTCCWGIYMQKIRRQMITERSGKDFDNSFGPIVVGCSFFLLLVMNFWFKLREVNERQQITEPTLDEQAWHRELV
ncbi:Vacuolar transporter chaperone 4 [Podosphaera aphanis]|nr:Vacuolar transporter chaperone 4 [Podosphaera aphanis]